MLRFKVILLTSEEGGGFYAHVITVRAREKREALLEALASHAVEGGNLDKVRATHVTGLPTPESLVPPITGRTSTGLQAVL